MWFVTQTIQTLYMFLHWFWSLFNLIFSHFYSTKFTYSSLAWIFSFICAYYLWEKKTFRGFIQFFFMFWMCIRFFKVREKERIHWLFVFDQISNRIRLRPSSMPKYEEWMHKERLVRIEKKKERRINERDPNTVFIEIVSRLPSFSKQKMFPTHYVTIIMVDINHNTNLTFDWIRY